MRQKGENWRCGTNETEGRELERWHLLTQGLNVHINLLRLIRDGGKWGDGYLCPTTYSLHCHHQNDSAIRWAAV